MYREKFRGSALEENVDIVDKGDGGSAKVDTGRNMQDSFGSSATTAAQGKEQRRQSAWRQDEVHPQALTQCMLQLVHPDVPDQLHAPEFWP